jgi:ABC-type multidrug transport system fused ATPase/permease subunit
LLGVLVAVNITAEYCTLPQIQKTIREETAGAIVITIAHRLKTVMDYDRILVLSDGEIVEFDTPAALLKKDGGTFQGICKQSSDWGIISRIGSTT